MEQLNILVVDDEAIIRKEIRIFLERKGFCVHTAGAPQAAFEILKSEAVDIVLLDIKMPEMDGLEALKHIKGNYTNIEVIMITGHGDSSTILSAMRLGAFDFFYKPVNPLEIENSIKRTGRFIEMTQKLRRMENVYSTITQEQNNAVGDIVGKSRALQNVMSMAKKGAESADTPVLITGESGTGKELVARYIHYMSDRKDQYFYTLNCSAIPESLIESELFGHAKGAFTGAVSDKMGCFEAGNKGTIFLDEIGDMPLLAQSKFLRVLEDRRVRRVGANRDTAVDVRIVSATNQDLNALIKEERFRLDLFYRINAFHIKVPPLRERVEDIPVLIDHYLQTYRRALKKNIAAVDGAVLEKFQNYAFPGNIRELKNLIERAVILSEGDTLTLNDFPQLNAHPNHAAVSAPDHSQDMTLAAMEISYLKAALKKANNNISEAAALLGITRQSLYRKMEKAGIQAQ